MHFLLWPDPRMGALFSDARLIAAVAHPQLLGAPAQRFKRGIESAHQLLIRLLPHGNPGASYI